MPQRDTLKREKWVRLKANALPNIEQREWIIVSRLKVGTVLLMHPDSHSVLEAKSEDIEEQE